MRGPSLRQKLRYARIKGGAPRQGSPDSEQTMLSEMSAQRMQDSEFEKFMRKVGDD